MVHLVYCCDKSKELSKILDGVIIWLQINSNLKRCCSMKYKKIHKRRLTKFGKIFFSFIIVMMIGIFSLCFINSKNNLYEKQETDNYSIEINYPIVFYDNLLAYSTE